jgi:hypothetical protein
MTSATYPFADNAEPVEPKAAKGQPRLLARREPGNAHQQAQGCSFEILGITS